MGVAHEWLVKMAWKSFRKTAAFKRVDPLILRWGAPFVLGGVVFSSGTGDVRTWRVDGVPRYPQDEVPHILFRTMSDGLGSHRFVSIHNSPEPIICTVTVRCQCPSGHVGSCSIWPNEKARLEIERRKNKRKKQ